MSRGTLHDSSLSDGIAQNPDAWLPITVNPITPEDNKHEAITSVRERPLTPESLLAAIHEKPYTMLADLLHAPGAILELRANVPGVGMCSGYFDDHEELERQAHELNRESLAVYLTLNPVDPEVPTLLDRELNRVYRGVTHATRDTSISRRTLLAIDIDPRRAGDDQMVNATREEWRKAFEKAQEVYHYLVTEKGLPEPIWATSGNGAYLLFAIDEPNTPRATGLVKGFLHALDARFSDEGAKIDVSMSNPSRLVKYFGTWALKGEATEERPVRKSAILHVPATMELVSTEKMAEIADEADVEPAAPQRGVAQLNPKTRRVDIHLSDDVLAVLLPPKTGIGDDEVRIEVCDSPDGFLLWNGSRKRLSTSWNENVGDYRLAAKILYRTGYDPAWVKALFESSPYFLGKSGYHLDKWRRAGRGQDDYAGRTIRKAAANIALLRGLIDETGNILQVAALPEEGADVAAELEAFIQEYDSEPPTTSTWKSKQARVHKQVEKELKILGEDWNCWQKHSSKTLADAEKMLKVKLFPCYMQGCANCGPRRRANQGLVVYTIAKWESLRAIRLKDTQHQAALVEHVRKAREKSPLSGKGCFIVVESPRGHRFMFTDVAHKDGVEVSAGLFQAFTAYCREAGDGWLVSSNPALKDVREGALRPRTKQDRKNARAKRQAQKRRRAARPKMAKNARHFEFALSPDDHDRVDTYLASRKGKEVKEIRGVSDKAVYYFAADGYDGYGIQGSTRQEVAKVVNAANIEIVNLLQEQDDAKAA